MKTKFKLNIYIKEIREHKKSLFYWSLGIIFFLMAAMSKYQGYVKSGVSITEMLKGMPSALGAIFGIGNIDLTKANGYFTVCVLYLAIMLGVHAVLLGSRIISKEEVDKTAEFLFTKPITRGQAFAAKTLAAFTVMFALTLVTTVSSVLIVEAFNEGPPVNDDIMLLIPSIFFIQIIFLTIGISFAAIMRWPKRAGQLSATILLATYILAAFLEITDKFDYLKYLTPFSYFDAKTIFIDRGYNTLYVIIAVVFVVAFMAISRIAFKRRDFSM